LQHWGIVKAAQDRKDNALRQLKLDLAVAALTICGGSVLAAVLGEITLVQAAGKVALDALCRTNMNDIFTKAKLASKNKVLEFSVGNVWQEIIKIANQEAMMVLANEFIGTNVQQSFTENLQRPHSKQTIMNQFVLKNTRNLRKACEALEEAKISAQDKTRMVYAMRQSNFCNPPTQQVLPKNYYEYIELTFYLKLVLNSDWRIQYSDNQYGFRTGYSKTPINAAPSSNEYPTNSIAYQRGFHNRSTTRVEYDDIGQDYINRMNDLYSKLIPGARYSKLINSSRFGETTSKQILEKAYTTLKTIGEMNKRLIFFPNGGKKMQL
jgi:hypothetical protein